MHKICKCSPGDSACGHVIVRDCARSSVYGHVTLHVVMWSCDSACGHVRHRYG